MQFMESFVSQKMGYSYDTVTFHKSKTIIRTILHVMAVTQWKLPLARHTMTDHCPVCTDTTSILTRNWWCTDVSWRFEVWSERDPKRGRKSSMCGHSGGT